MLSNLVLRQAPRDTSALRPRSFLRGARIFHTGPPERISAAAEAYPGVLAEEQDY